MAQDKLIDLNALSRFKTNYDSLVAGLYVPNTYRGGSTQAVDITDTYINGKIVDFNPSTLKEKDIVYFKADYEINIGVYQQLSGQVKIKVTYNNTNYYIYPRNRRTSMGAEVWQRISQLIVPKGGMIILSDFSISGTDIDANILNFVNNNQFTLKGWLFAGDTTLTFSDSRLTDTSVLDVYFDENHADLMWNTFTENTSPYGFSLTFDVQSEDILVTVLVTNVTSDKDGYDGTSS